MHAIVLQALAHSSVKIGGNQIRKHYLKAISSDYGQDECNIFLNPAMCLCVIWGHPHVSRS